MFRECLNVKLSLTECTLDISCTSHSFIPYSSPQNIHLMKKEMATHSRVLAWRIPAMAEPGGLPSVGSHRVRNN